MSYTICCILPMFSNLHFSQGWTIRKVMGGGQFSSYRNLFSLSNSLYGFFFRPQHEYFLGLIGAHEFFFRISLARIYIFFYFAHPPPLPPTYKFFNGPSLSTRQHTMAANEGVTKVIASFYRVDLDVVFLGLSYYLRPNIVPANFFWVFTLS